MSVAGNGGLSDERQDAPSEEELAEYHERLGEWIASIPDRVAELRSELTELYEGYDAFDVLANVWFANSATDPETYRESREEGLSAITEYVAHVLLSRKGRDGCIGAPAWPYRLQV